MLMRMLCLATALAVCAGQTGCATAPLPPPDMSSVAGAKYLVLAEKQRIFPEVKGVRDVWIQAGVQEPTGLQLVCLVSDDLNLAGVYTGPTMKVVAFYPSGRFSLRRNPRPTDPCDSALMTPFPELVLSPQIWNPGLITDSTF